MFQTKKSKVFSWVLFQFMKFQKVTTMEILNFSMEVAIINFGRL